MFDLVKAKYDQECRESGGTPTLNVRPQAAQAENKPNAAAMVLYVVLLVVPISLLVYGSIHLEDCPAEKMVAITLIVLGGLNLISRLLSSPYDFREAFGFDTVPKNLAIVCLNFVLQIVIICWFFALCYWIFVMKPDTKPEDHGASNYCALEFYRSVYWGSVVGLVLFSLVFIGTCCAICYILRKL